MYVQNCSCVDILNTPLKSFVQLWYCKDWSGDIYCEFTNPSRNIMTDFFFLLQRHVQFYSHFRYFNFIKILIKRGVNVYFCRCKYQISHLNLPADCCWTCPYPDFHYLSGWLQPKYLCLNFHWYFILYYFSKF